MEDLIGQIVELDGAMRARIVEYETHRDQMKEAQEQSDKPEDTLDARIREEAATLLRDAREQAAKDTETARVQQDAAEEALRQIFASHLPQWRGVLLARCLQMEAQA